MRVLCKKVFLGFGYKSNNKVKQNNLIPKVSITYVRKIGTAVGKRRSQGVADTPLVL